MQTLPDVSPPSEFVWRPEGDVAAVTPTDWPGTAGTAAELPGHGAGGSSTLVPEETLHDTAPRKKRRLVWADSSL